MTNLTSRDVEVLTTFAELLLHAGRDYAADAIYAAIEGNVVPTKPVLRLVNPALD